MTDEPTPATAPHPSARGIRVTDAEVVGVLRARDRAELHPCDDGDYLLRFNRKYLPPDEDPALARERSRRDVVTRIDCLLTQNDWALTYQFLSSFTFLAARVGHSGIDALLGDLRRSLSQFGGRRWMDVGLIHDAIALAEPILRAAPSQLPEQLLARLPPGRTPRTDRVRLLARQYNQAGAWLQPLTASFTGPGEGLRRVLERHHGLPSALAYTPDASFLVSADAHELLVWDTQSYEVQARLGGHGTEVTSLVITADATFIVAAVGGPFLYRWALQAGARPERLLSPAASLRTLLALPDGKVLSAATTGALHAWDIAGGHATRLGSLPEPVDGLALFPDGHQCLTVSGGLLSGPSTLTVWSLLRDKVLRTFRWEQGEIGPVAVSGDGHYVLAASNQLLLRWQLSDWAGPQELGRHAWRINAVTASADGRWAISADTGGGVQVWDLAGSAPPRVFRGHRMMVSAIALSPSGQLATTGSDQTVRIWDWPHTAATPLQAAHRERVTRLATWTRSGRQFAISASCDHTLAAFDLDHPTEPFRLTGHTHWVSDVAVAVHGARAVSASWDGSIALWNLTRRQRLGQIQTPDPHLQAVVVNQGGTRAVTAPYEGPIRLWDLAKKKQLAACDAAVGQVGCLALSPEGNRLLAGGRGLACLEVTADSLRPLGHLLDPGEQVQATAWFPESARCLAATTSGRLHHCDLNQGRILATWQDNTSGIAGVALSPCGHWAVTVGGVPHASSDDTLRLWECRTGQVLARFTGDCPLTACCISADGRLVAVGDNWGRLHVFSVTGIP